MTLNFSTPAQWLTATAEIVAGTIPSAVSSFLIHQDSDQMHSDTIDYLIKAFRECGKTQDKNELLDELDSRFISTFPSAYLFHACRVKNESSYRAAGLLPLDEDLLRRLAVDRFQEKVSRQSIEVACGKVKLEMHQRWLYFFTAPERARCPSQNHYLRSGSEMLGSLSWELGVARQGILSRQGKACIIECDVPTDYIVPMFREDIWRQLITHHFRGLAGAAYHGGPPDGGLAVTQRIPPERLIQFHYLDDSDYDYRRQFAH